MITENILFMGQNIQFVSIEAVASPEESDSKNINGGDEIINNEHQFLWTAV